MSKTHPRIPVKSCGNCAYRKSPVCLSLKLVQACVQISRTPERINIATLTTLIREAQALSRRKYKCSKEPDAWTHLMDKACAFWQPTEQDVTS